MNIKTGDRIKERRLLLKLSADEVALRLNKDRATIYRYEKNEIENMPLKILIPLAKILETTPQYLLGLDDIEEYSNNDDCPLDTTGLNNDELNEVQDFINYLRSKK